MDSLDPGVLLVSLATLSLLVGVLVGRALWGSGQQEIAVRNSDPFRSPVSNVPETAREAKASHTLEPAAASIPELASEIEEMTRKLVTRGNR